MRYLAEQFGLVASCDHQSQRAIATLSRRLNLLRDRIDHLADWLVTHSDCRHADLSYEQAYARATADIAAEFCFEPEHDTDEPSARHQAAQAPAFTLEA